MVPLRFPRSKLFSTTTVIQFRITTHLGPVDITTSNENGDMLNNTTSLLSQFSLNSSHYAEDVENSTFTSFYFWNAIIVAILSPIAVAGNSLVLAAIWRKPSLRSPSYILLAELAFTDLCTGLISQPFYVAVIYLPRAFGMDINILDMNTWPTLYLATRIVADSCINYFSLLTVLIITALSIERWLQMSRRSLVTTRRAWVAVAVLLPLPLPLVVYRVLHLYDVSVIIATISMTLLCLLFTSVAYFKVLRIIRHHQQQIKARELPRPNNAQTAINFAKYKKFVKSILYILAVFYSCYLPFTVAVGLMIVLKYNRWAFLLFNASVALVFLSSSLNPLLYLWRMRDIRNEVARLVKRVFCKSN